MATPVRHSKLEDVLGLLVGTFIVSLGLFLLNSSSAVTGGTAGLALLLNYGIPVPFGVLFLAINLPFFLLAIRGKGWSFAFRSGLAILLVSAFSYLHPAVVDLPAMNTWYAVLAGNALCGVGVLILFRHNSSLGGFNIAALILQERFGLRAGYVLMCLDAAVVLGSMLVVPPLNALVSAVGVVLLNLILALNHRPGRYLGA
nr:YitT family protein [Arthrobacter sp. JZ12]